MKKRQYVKYEVSRRNIELLKKYYPVDEAEKTVRACFQYDTADELLETQMNPDCMPQLKPELLEKIHDTIPKVPMPYRLNIQLQLNDFQGYEPEKIVESFSDSLEFMRFSKRTNNNKMFFLSALLVIVGYFILGMMVVSQDLGWFGSDFIAPIMEEVVDIVGTVFLWEAATISFLETSERSVSDPSIRKRIASLTVCNAEGIVLAETSHDKLFQSWGNTDKLQSIIRHGLLISGCVFILFGLDGFFYLLQGEAILGNEGAEYLNVIRLIIGIVSFCQISAGVGGFYRYFGRRNAFTKFSKAYAVIMVFMFGIILVISIFTMNFKDLLVMLASFSNSLIFIAAVFLDGSVSKQKE